MTKNKNWSPDDSFNDMYEGEFIGIREINEATQQLGLNLGEKIVTSRDPGMDEVTELLRRKNMPEGIDKWMLPITVGGMKPEHPAFVFIIHVKPGAVVPRHIHKNDSIFRIVTGGSVIQDGVELMPGDWTYIPVGKAYSYTGGKSGATLMHTYHK